MKWIPEEGKYEVIDEHPDEDEEEMARYQVAPSRVIPLGEVFTFQQLI